MAIRSGFGPDLYGLIGKRLGSLSYGLLIPCLILGNLLVQLKIAGRVGLLLLREWPVWTTQGCMLIG